MELNTVIKAVPSIPAPKYACVRSNSTGKPVHSRRKMGTDWADNARPIPQTEGRKTPPSPKIPTPANTARLMET